MIRQTLQATKLATYSVDLPNQRKAGMPSPTGTGFFVSPDGWFVTAAHVVTEDNTAGGQPRSDIPNGWLMKESPPGDFSRGMCQGMRLEHIESAVDFALLKLEFSDNEDKDHLKDRDGFPYVEVSRRALEEGEPVYSFGYPLSTAGLIIDTPTTKLGHSEYSPRTTSGIVAATMDTTEMIHSKTEPQVYVLDKALNYGNSGGPIIAMETGKAHAICSRFQPVIVPQSPNIAIVIPSLYGIVSRLSDPRILKQFEDRDIPISDN